MSAVAGFGGWGFGFLGGGYVVQKFRPQAAHCQNCWGGHGCPGAGSRSSICCPHRWQRILMSTSPLLMAQILVPCRAGFNRAGAGVCAVAHGADSCEGWLGGKRGRRRRLPG